MVLHAEADRRAFGDLAHALAGVNGEREEMLSVQFARQILNADGVQPELLGGFDQTASAVPKAGEYQSVGSRLLSMQSEKISRRRMLSRLGLTAATGTVAGALPASAAAAGTPRPCPAPMALNVQDFGAAGDGKKDNTEAFVASMRAAAETGNGVVFVPRGRYLIRSE